MPGEGGDPKVITFVDWAKLIFCDARTYELMDKRQMDKWRNRRVGRNSDLDLFAAILTAGFAIHIQQFGT